jgi:hypothetical protein
MAMIGEVGMINCGPGKLAYGFRICNDEDVGVGVWLAYESEEEAKEVRRDIRPLLASAIVLSKAGQ